MKQNLTKFFAVLIFSALVSACTLEMLVENTKISYRPVSQTVAVSGSPSQYLFIYDVDGYLTRVERYVFGSLQSFEEYSYNSAGQRIKVESFRENDNFTDPTDRIEYEYENGVLKKSVNTYLDTGADSTYTIYTFSNGKKTKQERCESVDDSTIDYYTFSYDSSGRRTGSAFYTGVLTVPMRTYTRTYNTDGTLKSVSAFDINRTFVWEPGKNKTDFDMFWPY